MRGEARWKGNHDTVKTTTSTPAACRTATARMRAASAWLEARRHEGQDPAVVWSGTHASLICRRTGKALQHPLGLLVELLWLLRKPEPHGLPRTPTHRWDGQQGPAVAA